MRICAGPARQLLRSARDRLDRVVAEVVEVLGGPPVAEAGRVVERALEVGVGHGPERVERGRPEARGSARGRARRPRSAPACMPTIATAGRPRSSAGIRPRPGAVRYANASESSSGASFMTSRNSRSSSRPRSAGCSTRPAEHGRADRVQRELDRGHDAEVAAAAAQRPEQLRMLLGGGADLARRPRSRARRRGCCRRRGRACARASRSRRRARGRRRRCSRRGRRRSRARGPGSPRRARPRSAPAPTRTTRRSGSTVISRMPRTSMTMPSSTSDRPATEWPPARTATRRLRRRAY